MKSIPSIFQIMVLTGFILLGIVGVIVFAGSGGLNSNKISKAVIWGTIPEIQFSELERLVNANDQVVDVEYVQIPQIKFQDTFVNALAEGNGPDAVLISDDLLYSQQGKLMVIPYNSYDQRTFSDTYINAAEHFLTPTGILGIPFTVDPLVMYYNRTMFSNAGIAQAPKTWKDLEIIVPKIVRINEAKGIIKAAIALGESRNIVNAKEILVTMLMQAGNPVTVVDSLTGITKSVIDEPGETIELPGVSVINFYTRFSNPTNTLYTWSRSMPDSKQAFLAGDLAMYFGYASEFESLKLKNPNLDFDVAPVPQNSTENTVTYGKLTAFSIVKKSPNAQNAFSVISKLTDIVAQRHWVDISKMPAVRRDVLADVPANKYVSTFYTSAIQTKTWTDPNPVFSTTIFRDMIEAVTTGLLPASQAVTTARQRLDLLLQGITS